MFTAVDETIQTYNFSQVLARPYKHKAPRFHFDKGRRSYVDIDLSTWNGEEFVEPVKHPEASRTYPGLYNGDPPPIGEMYDKKPFRMEVQAGKVYQWCSCGLSKTQVSKCC